MTNSWLRPLEDIILLTRREKARVVGLLGPKLGTGVSQISEVLAESFEAPGASCLLIDLSRKVQTLKIRSNLVTNEQ